MYIIRALLASLFLFASTLAASAQVMNRPGSLLVYPLVDNSPGSLQLLTITNTNLSTSGARGSVRVEFWFVEGATCARTTTAYTLTPGDTLTINTRFAAPNIVTGYAYAHATTSTGAPVSFNHLAGASFAASASGAAYEAHPFVFRASQPEGQLTNLDLDTVRDLNGSEYEGCPAQVVIPRFLASDGVRSIPRIAMVSLVGEQFQVIVDVYLFNDNEESFAVQTQFQCHRFTRLDFVSPAFSNSFLASTNHSQVEPEGLGLETGWYKAIGIVAYSTDLLIDGPPILVAHFDTGTVGGLHRSSPLPYGIGLRNNGDLGVLGPFGDQN